MQIKVLIADDNETLRRGIVTFLGKQRPEWQVFTATNGQEAIDALASFAPNVALLDIRMPVFSGVEVASHIVGAGLPIKVVFLTADDCSDVQLGDAAPAGTIFIDKANIVEDLLPALDLLLDPSPHNAAA